MTKLVLMLKFKFSFQIAIGALHIACVMLGKENLKHWFAELNVDMDKVIFLLFFIVNGTIKVK